MENLVGWKDLKDSSKAKEMLSNLKKGQLLAVKMKAVKNGKVQIEFAEVLNTPNPVRAAIGLLNKSDDRFNFGSRPRRSWETATPQDVKNIFGFDEIPEDESSVEILQLIPDNINDLHFGLQINEITEAGWKERNANKKHPEDEQFLESKLKRAGAEGEFFRTVDGERVVSEPILAAAPVGTEIVSTYLEGSYTPVGKAVSSQKEITVVI